MPERRSHGNLAGYRKLKHKIGPENCFHETKSMQLKLLKFAAIGKRRITKFIQFLKNVLETDEFILANLYKEKRPLSPKEIDK